MIEITFLHGDSVPERQKLFLINTEECIRIHTDRTLSSPAPSLEDHTAVRLNPSCGLFAQFPYSVGVLI